LPSSPGGGSNFRPGGGSGSPSSGAGRSGGGAEGSTGSSPFAGLRDIESAFGQPVSGTSGRSTTTKQAEKKRETAADGVVGAAKGVTKKLRAGAEAVVDDFVLVIVGLLMLLIAFLGSLVLYRMTRQHLLP
jgi:hypothetical protein